MTKNERLSGKCKKIHMYARSRHHVDACDTDKHPHHYTLDHIAPTYTCCLLDTSHVHYFSVAFILTISYKGQLCCEATNTAANSVQ